MKPCPLSTLLTAVLGTAALVPVMAQGTATKPKSTPPPVHTSTKPAAAPASTSDEQAVVGICNAHKITWGQLVTRIRLENPKLLDQSAAAYIATKAQEVLFGKSPHETFTITRSEAINSLRLHPNEQISKTLELMLTQAAVDDEATRENVQPTQKQVDEKVTTLLKSLRDSGQIQKTQTDNAFLVEHGVTLEKLKTNYRPQCQLLNLINKDLTRQLGHPAGAGDLVQASHILIAVKDLPPTATDAEKKKADADALARIKAILGDIRTGKIKFEDSAKANSDDPGSKEKGGDLGIFMKGMMLKEFENAAFSAKPMQVTEPVKTSAGYHIIMVTKPSQQISPVEAKQFIEKYEQEQIQNFLSKVVEKDNHVENRLQKLLPPAQQQPGFPQGARPGRPQ